jgi:DNA polymerase
MGQANGTIEIEDKTYDIVTVDFETYYDKDYTLAGRGMNMSEYIRDARFHAHGASIKIGNAPAKWVSTKQLKRALQSIDWSRTALLCHNTPFDGFILSEHFDIIPAFYLDTLAMSRAVHGHALRHDLDSLARRHGHGGKVKRDALANTKGKLTLTKEEEARLGEYAIDDNEDTYKVFWNMYDYFPDDEFRLVDLTTRMFCDPVLYIDIPRVENELAKEVGAKTAALLLTSATPQQLSSNTQFADLLKEAGIRPPVKISPTTGKATYAFAKSDLDFQKLLNHANQKVRDLANARLRYKSTIGETRAIRFLEAGKDGNKLPILLNYSGAHTHRWSGSNKMNLQNLKRGGELRRSILAPPGHVIVVADSSQIEARTLAWLADQMDIINAFANKEDVYKLMASAIYNVPVDEITPEQRFIGKACVLGLGYGMGATKLQLTLKTGALGPPVEISLAECMNIVEIYRNRNMHIRMLWKRMEHILESMAHGAEGTYKCLNYGEGFIQLPNGLWLHYPKLQGEPVVDRSGNVSLTNISYQTLKGRNKIYGGLLTENVTQALARCIIGEQMLIVSEKYRIVTMTHDEIVTVCPEDQADECLDFLLTTMSTPPEWAPDLPLAAEGGYDVCYSK